MGCRAQAFDAAFRAARQVRADQAALIGVLAFSRDMDVDPHAVEPRAVAEAGREELVTRGVVDHPDAEPVGVAITDADAKVGYALKEVGRPVDWVDDPQSLCVDG